jgi:hypothetical protein
MVAVTKVQRKVPYPRVQAWFIVIAAGGLAGALVISSWHSSHELQACTALAVLLGALVMDMFARRGIANAQDPAYLAKASRSRVPTAGALVGTLLVFALPGSLQLVLVGVADGVFVAVVVRGCLSGELKARFRRVRRRVATEFVATPFWSAAAAGKPPHLPSYPPATSLRRKMRYAATPRGTA